MTVYTGAHPELLLTGAIVIIIAMAGVLSFLLARALNKIDKNQEKLFNNDSALGSRIDKVETNYAYLKGVHDERTGCSSKVLSAV